MTVALQYIEMKGPVNILQITEAIDCSVLACTKQLSTGYQAWL